LTLQTIFSIVILALQDEQALERAAAWRSLQDDLSVASLQAFLQKYPQGAESNEARAKLNDFSYR
jgi:hypothetical protein